MNNRDKYTDYDALPLVLEVKDIQNILGISRTTAYALVKQPDFTVFFVRTTIRYPASVTTSTRY